MAGSGLKKGVMEGTPTKRDNITFPVVPPNFKSNVIQQSSSTMQIPYMHGKSIPGEYLWEKTFMKTIHKNL